jgi:hypothetical protein
MSEKLKKLTGKNPKDFEPVAYNLINNCDIELFAELVENDDFLFDFIKNNVAKRIKNVINEKNYLNLLHFLKYYSPSYEDVIISTLVKYANEDLTDIILEKFENGTEITPEVLLSNGVISKVEANGVKVLGNGTLTKKLVVKASKFSKSAVEAIEKAGGTVEVL